MSYSTYTSIYTIVPGLAQTTTVQSLVGSHITRADSLIDAFVGKRYTLPFAKVPPLVRSISEDIVTYYTYRSYYTADNLRKLDYFEELRGGAMDTLRMIAKGDIELFDTSGSSSIADTQLVEGTHEDYTPIFDVDDPLDWKVDSELLDAIRDGRK